jgi:ABC-2 type transport system ATP-binding protein
MLASILNPSSGTAWIDGHNTVEEPVKVRSIVGVLTELPGLYGRMRAREYLRFFGELYGLGRADCDRRAEQLMASFGMDDVWHLRLGEYSKGMRQKLALIRSMLHDPRVLLLDEPTSAMDPHSAKIVRDSILSLRTQERAIVICTHNLAEAEMIADRIAIIRRGEIVATGTVGELTRQLLGVPQLELRLAGAVDGAASLIADLVQIEEHGADWIRYRADQIDAVNPEVLRRLTEAGHRVVTLSQVPHRLEEVYLRVVAKTSSAEEVRRFP